MTVDQAIEEYLRMARTVFKSPSFGSRRLLRWGSQTAFDGKALEKCLRGTVMKHLGDPDARLFEASEPPCRVAVLAARSAHADAPPHLFQNDVATPSFRIIDVALATSAAAGLFPTVSLSEPPIDPGLAGYNNPTEVALSKAHETWPHRDTIVLSIGTGTQRIVDAAVGNHWGKLADLSQRLIESCKATHDRLIRSQDLLSYFRFSVDRGLDQVGMKEWKEAEGRRLTGITSAYLGTAELARCLNLCVRVVHGDSDPLREQELNSDCVLLITLSELLVAFSGLSSDNKGTTLKQ